MDLELDLQQRRLQEIAESCRARNTPRTAAILMCTAQVVHKLMSFEVTALLLNAPPEGQATIAEAVKRGVKDVITLSLLAFETKGTTETEMEAFVQELEMLIEQILEASKALLTKGQDNAAG